MVEEKLPKGCCNCKESKTCEYLKLGDPFKCKKRNQLKNGLSFSELRCVEKTVRKNKRVKRGKRDNDK